MSPLADRGCVLPCAGRIWRPPPRAARADRPPWGRGRMPGT